MRSLPVMGLMLSLSSIFLSSLAFAAPNIVVQIGVYWEGRDLQDPNIEALDRLRKAFPAIPLTHFVNPAYFLDEAKNTESIAAFQRVFADADEVGLYLAPIESLVKDAGVILKLSPSFWGYVDEGEVCEKDCGLDVPMAVYNREEALKILASAHQAMLKAGFRDLRSFAVRGWLEAPFITRLAFSFGYRYDLSPIDPDLVVPKLKEFPISAWVSQRWAELAGADGEAVQKLVQSQKPMRWIPQRGGLLDLSEQREILARFDRLVKERREHPELDDVFTLGISVETAFQSWPKLRLLLSSLEERAKKQDFKLKYVTASGEKNSRPTALNMAISTRFMQQAEARK